MGYTRIHIGSILAYIYVETKNVKILIKFEFFNRTQNVDKGQVWVETGSKRPETLVWKSFITQNSFFAIVNFDHENPELRFVRALSYLGHILKFHDFSRFIFKTKLFLDRIASDDLTTLFLT